MQPFKSNLLPAAVRPSLMRLLVRMLIFSSDSLVKGRTSYCSRGRFCASDAAAFATAKKPRVESPPAEFGASPPAPPLPPP